MFDMFSYSFMVRAFIVGLFVSVSSSLLGVSLVLRKNSMIGDGLSHVGFGALAFATALSFSPLAFTIPVVVIAAILILRIKDQSAISSESMIAVISSSSLAIGVLIISFVRGTNTDINNFLFGSLLSVSNTDAILSVVLSALVIAIYILLYPRLYAVTFDSVFAKSAGIKAESYNTLLAVLSALVIVTGMRMMGSLLISALIIFPSLSAMRIKKTYKSVSIASVLISIIVFFFGITLSYMAGTPIGASMVALHLFVLISFSLASKIAKKS